jgi:hypothetical protein
MVGLKITSNNLKLVKLWFFIKFLNFSKNSEILTQVKTSYYKAPRKFSEFFDNLIENYKFILYKTSQKILIKSWPRLKPTPAFAIPPPMEGGVWWLNVYPTITSLTINGGLCQVDWGKDIDTTMHVLGILSIDHSKLPFWKARHCGRKRIVGRNSCTDQL